ncbi:MAG: VOC family protein, partial [Candidatus Entotheonellia bacterium]
MMAANGYDRTSQDIGNILLMEHVNVTIPNQEQAHLFYAAGLGFTRDPYMMVGPENMWINVGQQQFHLPTREKPQKIPGHIGIVVPDLEQLKARLTAVQPRLAGTQFTCSAENGYVEAICPWGNHFRCHAPGPEFGDMTLGIPYVEFLVKSGTASGIGQFYKEVMQASYTLTQDMHGGVARVKVGIHQWLVFRETNEEIPEYDGHHIAVYVANFSGPHSWLKRHDLITQESSNYQYRFQDIAHPETGRKLFAIEHEVRSFTHPMYGRDIVNRNAAQNMGGYSRGRDVFVPAGR